MNTFVSEKLGEVLAFSRAGKDTLEKGKKAFLGSIDEISLATLGKQFEEIESSIATLVTAENVSVAAFETAKHSADTITAMRDTYIEGKWSEESELLEWMGFYTGAALVHWQLIAGAAESLKHERLITLSTTAIAFYRALFVSDEKLLRKLGASHAR